MSGIGARAKHILPKGQPLRARAASLFPAPPFTRPRFPAINRADAIRRDPNYYPQNDPLRWGGGYARDLSGILEPAPPNGAGRLSLHET